MTNTEMQTGATDSRRPSPIVDGVVVGSVLGDNSPGDKALMRDHWEYQKDHYNLVSR